MYNRSQPNPPRWEPRDLNAFPTTISSDFAQSDHIVTKSIMLRAPKKNDEFSSETPLKSRRPLSISIRSPRSVFEPVHQCVPQRIHDASSFEQRDDVLQPYFREDSHHGNHIQADVLNSIDEAFFQSISKKDKPLEHKFKPIVMDDDLPLNSSANEVHDIDFFSPGQNGDHDFLFPQIQANALSSRAKRRSLVPFAYVIIPDDGSNCTDMSAISYDSFEFEIMNDDFEPFVGMKDHRELDVEASYALLQETKELMDRIARHNLGGDTDQQKNRIQYTNIEEQEPILGIFSLKRVGTLDKESILEETGRLLTQIEELPLPEDIAALMDEEETQQLENKVVKNDVQIPKKERRPSIIEEMDLAFLDDEQLQVQKKENPLQKSEVIPSDIDALIQDDDLSFDDLRDDTEDEHEESRKGASHKENKTLITTGCLETLDNAIPRTENQIECNTKKESLTGTTEKNGAANNIHRVKPSKRSGQDEIFRPFPLLDGDTSENGGIANIILELERKESSTKPFDSQRERSHSPPLKEIYIPVNYDTMLGSSDLTACSSFNTKRNHRVQSKKDNDTRIQNIIKRGCFSVDLVEKTKQMES
eukprot:CAMPEP_0176481452 /NCGR_PEP_ID=MMETSP0200_2-20121128/2828_1 /TAXON_ID=947934 /ORGANISM="Chaetoceros sp., Strain GSL56" /LENGTH=589 /DNA_ID=CAMNT_0017877659 /DNA_START=81 /DNA_END=1850 /DNA_ORIENTATION=-